MCSLRGGAPKNHTRSWMPCALERTYAFLAFAFMKAGCIVCASDSRRSYAAHSALPIEKL